MRWPTWSGRWEGRQKGCGIVKESRPCQHASWLRLHWEEAANNSIIPSFCCRDFWVMDSIPWVRLFLQCETHIVSILNFVFLFGLEGVRVAIRWEIGEEEDRHEAWDRCPHNLNVLNGKSTARTIQRWGRAGQSSTFQVLEVFYLNINGRFICLHSEGTHNV